MNLVVMTGPILTRKSVGHKRSLGTRLYPEALDQLCSYRILRPPVTADEPKILVNIFKRPEYDELLRGDEPSRNKASIRPGAAARAMAMRESSAFALFPGSEYRLRAAAWSCHGGVAWPS